MLSNVAILLGPQRELSVREEIQTVSNSSIFEIVVRISVTRSPAISWESDSLAKCHSGLTPFGYFWLRTKYPSCVARTAPVLRSPAEGGEGGRMGRGRMRRPSGRRDADRCGRDTRAALCRAGGGARRTVDITDGHCEGPCFAGLTSLSSPGFPSWGFRLGFRRPCGTHDLVLMGFQGRCPWLISEVPVGRS